MIWLALFLGMITFAGFPLWVMFVTFYMENKYKK